jgi:excisionase family DNA binding protein
MSTHGETSMMISVADAMALAGLGKTSIYRLAAAGQFRIRKVGRRSLIERAEFASYLANLPAASLKQPKTK